MSQPRQSKLGLSKLDLILDKFSKAHPFADTRAYNVFHAEAKEALNQYMLGSFLELLKGQKMGVPPFGADIESDLSAGFRKGWNNSIDQLRQAAKERFQ